MINERNHTKKKKILKRNYNTMKNIKNFKKFVNENYKLNERISAPENGWKTAEDLENVLASINRNDVEFFANGEFYTLVSVGDQLVTALNKSGEEVDIEIKNIEFFEADIDGVDPDYCYNCYTK